MMEKKIYKFNENWNLHKEDLKEKKFYLFNVKDGDIIRLNEVSFDILSNIDGGRTIRKIFEIMQKTYDVDEKKLWDDIINLISKCLEKNILAEL